MCAEDSRMWLLAWPSTYKSTASWAFGLPSITDTIQPERVIIQSHHCELSKARRTTGDAVECSLPAVRVRITLPQWISYKALETIACRAQIGWKQYLRVRNIFPKQDFHSSETPFSVACTNIFLGYRDELKSQIENRELTPWDEDSSGTTLLTVGATHIMFILPSSRQLQIIDVPRNEGCNTALSMGYLQLSAGLRPEHAKQIKTPSKFTDVRLRNTKNITFLSVDWSWLLEE